jgi:hypothetical protein
MFALTDMAIGTFGHATADVATTYVYIDGFLRLRLLHAFFPIQWASLERGSPTDNEPWWFSLKLDVSLALSQTHNKCHNL